MDQQSDFRRLKATAVGTFSGVKGDIYHFDPDGADPRARFPRLRVEDVARAETLLKIGTSKFTKAELRKSDGQVEVDEGGEDEEEVTTLDGERLQEKGIQEADNEIEGASSLNTRQTVAFPQAVRDGAPGTEQAQLDPNLNQGAGTAEVDADDLAPGAPGAKPAAPRPPAPRKPAIGKAAAVKTTATGRRATRAAAPARAPGAKPVAGQGSGGTGGSGSGTGGSTGGEQS